MTYILGFLIVTLSIVGSYMANGGHMDVLWQPFEFTLIGGAAIGSYVFGNSKAVLKATKKGVGRGFKGAQFKKEHYKELLTLLYQVFKLIKSKGILAIEQHVEKPHESSLFHQFPLFSSDHHNVDFLCDYLRMWTLGTDNPYQFEDLIDKELAVHHEEVLRVPTAIQTMADAFPALGIVAAVLGVIHTMGSINEPPSVLGHLIGAALVGTFFGVLMSYGYFAPIANSIKQAYESDGYYHATIKAGLLAHMNGYPPSVSMEFARKAIPDRLRPTFYELEEAVNQLPPPT